jgi:hypothetical protein
METGACLTEKKHETFSAVKGVELNGQMGFDQSM